MKLILGLGNVGPTYEGTRHNIGFMVVDALAGDETWLRKVKFKADVAEIMIGDERVILAKPTTYYNLSGEALLAIKQFYKIDNEDILVIHDDIDLPFGVIRTRHSGSDAGNNGIKSIIAAIGPDFARIRIGTANEHLATADAADFVLNRFSHEEHPKLQAITTQSANLARNFITGKLEQTTHSH